MAIDPEELGHSKSDLAQALREIRVQAGLAGDRLARRCGMTQSKISKIETGRTIPSLVDVELILRALEVPAELAQRILDLARVANTEWQDVRALRRKGLEKKQAELAALDQSSTEIRYFLLSMLNTLLATPEYIRASLAHVPGDTSKAIAKKLERQTVIYDDSKTFTFLLTEQAVRWAMIPHRAMVMQIDRLISVSRLPNVHLGVIPLGKYIPESPLNTFTVYDNSLATVETETGIVILRDRRDIQVYRDAFAMYEGHALFGEQACERMADWSSLFLGGL
ncbi:Scr1 family TA system antitoxin-like transcriptional regulator [Kitasatospora sp. NPDC056651]|uniref:Scr1 family TA system antitoxin-like transcriptional regulator n=1 Tax=Kitasatospora sp. NPDC056651 TaxID=3345892 RepID=UPI00369FC00C